MIMLRYLYKIFFVLHLYATQKIYTFCFKIFLLINNCSFGRNLKTYNAIPTLRISKDMNLFKLGDNIRFNNYSDVSWYCKNCIHLQKGASLIVGDNTGFNGVLIFSSQRIEIGDFVNIGGGTKICDTDFHNLEWDKRREPSTNTKAKTAPIIIDDDVFIGMGCTILKGVHIGPRAIIGAGSVVCKDIPADCIAGGNPCRVIKTQNKHV